MKSPFFKIFFLATAALSLSGCSLATSSTTTAKLDGGVWRSGDSGKTFIQINDVLSTKGKILSMNNADINSLAFDPQDPTTIYAASAANGIFYTNDSGASWQQFEDLKQGAVSDILVDAQDKCAVYATMSNKLFKTENCGRDWNNIYFHQKSQVALTALAGDAKSPAVLYLGTSEGEILKSADGGHSWQTVYRVAGGKIMDIIVDPYESKIIYAGTAKKGLYKSSDAGANWNSLGAGLESYSGSHEYRKLIYDPATPNALIFSSKFGLLRTIDGGNTWKIIELLPAHKTTNILAVGVNPLNSAEFYYVTASTLVKTADAGVKWSSLALPYNRLTTDIKINPAAGSIVYLATRKASN